MCRIVVAALLVVRAAGPEVPVTDGHVHLLAVVARVARHAGNLRTHRLGLELARGTDGAPVSASVTLTRGRLASGLRHHGAFLDVSHLVLNLLHYLFQKQ